MRISDGSSDVCSSDLPCFGGLIGAALVAFGLNALFAAVWEFSFQRFPKPAIEIIGESCYSPGMGSSVPHDFAVSRSEEHTSELQSLMRISYAVFCLKKKTKHQ